MKRFLALLLLSPLTFADSIKDELTDKILINSSAISDYTSTIQLKGDNSLFAELEGHGSNGVKTTWVGAYEWSTSQDYVTLYADTNVCTYYVKKVGKFYSFDIISNSNRSYSNICPNLLMKILL